ncbi:MAG: GMC family oxidoreductase [Proteobacteria bacterium]|nr:GMC family oxidoreductase [Pseudomonadota bacterium]
MSDYDVIIIGAGMGGAASAYALTKRGLKVLILEAGPAYNPATDYRLDKPDWEKERFPFKPNSQGKYTFGTEQSLDDSKWSKLRSWNHQLGLLNPTNTRKFGAYHHVRGVGGSTLHFTGEAHRLHPEAMQMYTRFGVAADWPLNYAELEPYYIQAENLIGVAGAKFSIRHRSAPFPLPPHAPSYSEQVLAKGFDKLGLSWTPNSLAILSEPYANRPACNYCAACNLGCPRGDKGSADVTFIQAALQTGKCDIKTGMQVLRLKTGKNDKINSVIVTNGEKQHKFNAPLYILAAGAIETPRLLLASEVGNDSGQVGRNFMETLFHSSLALHPEPLGSHRGLPSGFICWDYNAPDAIPNIVGGCRFSPAVAEAGFIGAGQYATRVIPGWGRKHKQAMRQSCANILGMSGIGESLPNKNTYIDLDFIQTDEHGIPLARIHSQLTEMDKQRLKFIADTSENILHAAGAGKIFERYSNYDFFNTTHVFGTCRMGINPENSVVNANLRSHHWQNLYIADTSVFPSSGGGESPSLTIAALALRMAEFILH